MAEEPAWKCYLTGGASNIEPSLSLGGERSNTIVEDYPHRLFHRSYAVDSEFGGSYFRVIDFVWTKPTTQDEVKAFIFGGTLSPSTGMYIGYDPTGNVELPDERTPPAGISMLSPNNLDEAIDLGICRQGEAKRMVVQWFIAPGAENMMDVGHIAIQSSNPI